MEDAFGSELSVGDYVACVLGDWVNHQHLGKVVGGGKVMVNVEVKIYERPVETRLIRSTCLVKVNRDVAIRFSMSR